MKEKHLLLKSTVLIFVLLIISFCIHAHLVGDRLNIFVRDLYSIRNLERINKAIILYAEENEKMPSASKWADSLVEKNELLFKMDFITPTSYDHFGIYYNNALENKSLSSINKDTVVLFTARGEWNSNGNKKVFYEKTTGRKYYHVITLNGDVYRHDADDDTYLRLKDAQTIKSESLYWE